MEAQDIDNLITPAFMAEIGAKSTEEIALLLVNSDDEVRRGILMAMTYDGLTEFLAEIKVLQACMDAESTIKH